MRLHRRNLLLGFALRLVVAVCAAVLLVAVTGVVVHAGGGELECGEDGRPVLNFHGGPPNTAWTVYANGQEVGSGTTDAEGNGSLAFGEPGVTYAVEIAFIFGQGDKMPMPPVGEINCPKPEPKLTILELDPPTVTMQGDGQQDFKATGLDQFDEPFPLTDTQWSTTGGTLTNCQGDACTYTAPSQAGDYTITVQQNGTPIKGTATLHVDPAPLVLTDIELSPDSVTMRVNEQRVFTATGKDQYGKDYPISSPVWSTSGGGTLTSSGTSATYTATSSGDHTITVKQDGTSIEGRAPIFVKPDTSVLTTIELSPDSVTMRVNEQRVFTATGKDQYGKDYPISNPIWSTSGGGTLPSSGTSTTYTATTAGNFELTVQVKDVSAKAQIEVAGNPGSVPWVPIIGGGIIVAGGAGYFAVRRIRLRRGRVKIQ